MNRSVHVRVAAVTLAAVMLIAATVALAQPYPSRPLKLVVPFPAGGPADVLGRVVTQALSEALATPVVVDKGLKTHPPG